MQHWLLPRQQLLLLLLAGLLRPAVLLLPLPPPLPQTIARAALLLPIAPAMVPQPQRHIGSILQRLPATTASLPGPL